MLINRYILKVKKSILDLARVGDPIMSPDSNEDQDEDYVEVLGFIGDIFHKSRAIEICLFDHINMKTLKVNKKHILYYESNYDVRTRYKQIKEQLKK